MNRNLLLLLTATVVIGLPMTAQAQQSHTEDFTTTTYEDAINTTADWNTDDGELKLFPFEYTLVGSYNTPGQSLGAVVSGNYCYVADDAEGLQVIDISDPENPTPAGSYDTPGNAYSVAVAGDYAFVGDSAEGLQVIDISDPTNPTFAGSYDTPGLARDVVLAGNYAYVADGTYGVRVIDISDPTNPTSASNFNTPGSGLGVAISGDRCFVADGTSGIRVHDISDPTNPTFAGSYNSPGDARQIFVAGDYLYLADGPTGIYVLDISDPDTPTYAGGSGVGFSYDITVSGDRCYVALNNSGIKILDVSDPTSPALIESLTGVGNARSVCVDGEYAYLGAAGYGLSVVRVGYPAVLTLAGSYNTPDDAREVTVAGDHAFVTDWHSGLQVIDISDPTSPTLAGSYVTPTEAYRVAVAGNFAFVAATFSGLQVIDISDPTNPTLAGSYNTPGIALGVAISGDYAFVADDAEGLQVIDISDPTNPTLSGSYPTTNFKNVAVAGDLAFMLEGGFGLRVLDISDPTNPTLSGSYPTTSSLNDMAVAGDYAYGVLSDDGLIVLDISDPTNPTLAGSYDTPGTAYGVAVAGDRAFVGDHTSGLWAIDISDPTNPALAGSYNTPGWALGVTVAGDHAFVADYASGLQVIQVHQQEINTADNIGQSLAVDEGSDTILRARLTSTETSGVSWELSADAGTNWQAFVADGAWTKITVPGDDLLWRSTLTWVDESPTVSDLAINWLNESGVITSITDIPNDQGKQVSLEWRRSGHDFLGEPLQIVEYALYRWIDPNLHTQVPEIEPSLSPEASDAVVMHARMMREANWHFIATVPVRVEDDYAMVVPTLADSTIADGQYYSTFMVSALTATPGVFFDSPPDSGHSVDNIAPGVPVNLAANYEANGVTLDWDDALEGDFQYHRVYRGTDAGFIPAPGNLVQETASSAWTDPASNPWGYIYKVTTLDHAGNESEAAEMQSVSGVGDNVVPTKTALLSAYPNPFNPSTKLSFELATPARVRLNIFDAAGRLVNTLVDEQRGVGRHEFVWNGQNTAGQSVASGVYLYRFEAGDVVQTKRMMLVK